MTTKEYALSIEVQTSHLFAHVSGTRSREAVIAITTKVLNAALVNSLPKVLVDVRALKGRLSVLDTYSIVTELFENLRRKGIRKAAIVDKRESGMREWFLETVAVNRGFNLRIFSDGEEALRWLLAFPEIDKPHR